MAAAVAENLDLNVPGTLDVLLDVETALLEIATAEPIHLGKRGFEFGRVPAQLHADATTAGGALQHHRVADRLSGAQRRRDVRQQAGARQEPHTLLLRDLAGRVLQAEAAHLLRLGTNEDDAGGRTGFGKTGVFAQKAIARMDRLRSRLLRHFENLLPHQIALRGRRRAD